MKKYKVGIIGYGGFGKFLHYWWSKIENVEVAAVADHGSHIQDAKNLKLYSNWEDLIADPEIDIVSIVTPPGLHAEMACAAMRAGKHVLLEKPISITEEEARQIVEMQKQTGRVITVDHMIRYNPIIQTFKELSDKGVFGKIRHAVVNNYAQDESLAPEHWFWNKEISGGIMVEHGVHFFDIINALGGQKREKVCGVSHDRNEQQRDRVSALVLYNEGLIASYYHAFSGPGFFEQTTIELAYDLARIEIEGWMPMKGKLKVLVNSDTRPFLKNIPGWKENHSENFAEMGDESRPEGWGSSQIEEEKKKGIYAGGIAYDTDQMVLGTFEIPQTKGEVYGNCVQLILSDMIRKIEDENHTLAITLEDAFEALRTAILASN
ncbi:Gfo/Idh/MocA family protein [Flavobacterium ustbae]|uniref:Gfo/Idh/MocA family protein n=1 Tax=Flavobacterium ustbae TaxID=2488790 RepID=UPI0013DD922B|nr:Gfo/Idh/MocA family oxidoreductase [Flavobacterium ustbae]